MQYRHGVVLLGLAIAERCWAAQRGWNSTQASLVWRSDDIGFGSGSNGGRTGGIDEGCFKPGRGSHRGILCLLTQSYTPLNSETDSYCRLAPSPT